MSGFAINPDVGLWQKNAVLNGKNSYYVTDEVEGTLSVKTMLSGRGHWITPDGRHSLEEGAYLILNRGQRYSVDIRTRELSETFCAFFRPGYVEAVADAAHHEPAGLLELSHKTTETSFYERVNPVDEFVWPALSRLRAAVRRGLESDLEADDLMIGLALGLLKANQAACTEAFQLDISSEGTREEIFRRLNRARDFIFANLSESLDLVSISSAASLSPFHFHRLFKRAFAETPHEFLTRLRLAKAKRLLVSSVAPLAEVSWSVGFEGPASFSKVFKRATGVTPLQFRKAASSN